MKLDFDGRIRNINLPYTHALMPLFEAIINSVHAIEDTKRTDGRIKVEIIRDTGGSEKFSTIRASGNITGFTIEDNGIGFTTDNYTSFETNGTSFPLHSRNSSRAGKNDRWSNHKSPSRHSIPLLHYM